jgi:cholesterol transport system auxiliary component
MKVGMSSAALYALCVGLFAGCTLFAPIKIDTTKNALNKVPLDLPSETTHSVTLLVLIPEATPVYASTRMVYTTDAYQVAYFRQNEWAETPAQMIQPLIVTAMSNTHYFSEVLSPPHFDRHTFVLRSEVLELKQDFTSEPAMLQLAIRFHLIREATNQVIATKELSVREPMRERNPHAGVVAANEAIAKVLRELASFIIEKAG